MTDDFRRKLEFLCFDVIGDHTEPENYKIVEEDKKIKVVVKARKLYSPKAFVVEDWEREVKDRKDFANVELCFE